MATKRLTSKVSPNCTRYEISGDLKDHCSMYYTVYGYQATDV